MSKLATTIIFASSILLISCWPDPRATSLSPTSTPTPTPLPVTAVKITKPVEGGRVDQNEVVKGTSQQLPADHVIWVVVFVHKVGRYYPQNQPADIQVNGEWANLTYIGVARDIGLKFDVIAVLADKAGQDALNAYLTDAKNKSDYSGLERLPPGVTVHDRVSVTRK